jgi:uncharacterized protein (TIGR02452 family)
MSKAPNYENQKIFKDTLNLSKELKNESYKYSGLLIDYKPIKKYNKTNIYVKNIDCLEEAKLYKNVGVLNNASDICPGGGVHKGSTAQEEIICRRTSLYPSLKKQEYPLNKLEIIYSPNVNVFKDVEYNILSQPFMINVLTCAALRKPEIKENNKYKKNIDRLTMKNKIRLILETAAYHGLDNLVLGGFGCGVFMNPPEEVVTLFNEFIGDSGDFKGVFDNISFAILEKGEGYLNNIFKKILLK